MHVDPDLSAYLDGELAPAERARVESHLGACGECAERLSELRATASLVSALPARRPARLLVPAVTPRFVWLRPLRALSAVASGLFLFAFLLTAVARSSAGLGGGDQTAPQSAFATGGAAAPFAANAPAASTQSAVPPAAPAPAAGAAADTSQRSAASTAAPSAAVAPLKAASSTGPAASAAAEPEAARPLTRAGEPSPLSDPRLWLVLAITAAALAVLAHLRLRRA